MNVGPLHTLILSAAPPLNHYYIPLPQLLWAGAHNFEGVSPLHSALPDKAINLFFSTSPKTLFPRFNLVPGPRGWILASMAGPWQMYTKIAWKKMSPRQLCGNYFLDFLWPRLWIIVNLFYSLALPVFLQARAFHKDWEWERPEGRVRIQNSDPNTPFLSPFLLLESQLEE